MEYLCKCLNAKKVMYKQKFVENDVLILPLKWQSKLIQKSISIHDIKNLIVFMPFYSSLLAPTNEIYAYMEDTDLIKENAKLTALGIVNKLSDLKVNILQMNVDIIGYGYCAKALMKLLDSMQIKYQCIYYKKTSETILPEAYQHRGNVIVNTAPVCIFEKYNDVFSDIEYMMDISSNKCFKYLQGKVVSQIIFPGSLPEIYFYVSSSKLIEHYVRSKLDEK